MIVPMSAVRNPSFLVAIGERETLRERCLMAIAPELDRFGLPNFGVGTGRFGHSCIDGRQR